MRASIRAMDGVPVAVLRGLIGTPEDVVELARLLADETYRAGARIGGAHLREDLILADDKRLERAGDAKEVPGGGAAGPQHEVRAPWVVLRHPEDAKSGVEVAAVRQVTALPGEDDLHSIAGRMAHVPLSTYKRLAHDVPDLFETGAEETTG